jgi:threonine dehydratase
MVTLDFDHARRAVARHGRVTPLLHAPELTEQLGREVYLKAECLQNTGSFKVRGASARLEALSENERLTGVVACSSGNHGRAVAFVADRMGIPATIFVPEWVDPVKLAGIQAAGAEARTVGSTFDESESAAVAEAAETGRTYVSAYDDPWVIAGQGTIAFEVESALGERPSAIIAALSGGGLLAGIAGAFGEERTAVDGRSKGHSRNEAGLQSPVRTVGCSAANAAVMLASVQQGQPVELPEQDTLANALAGGIGLQNRFSFDLVRDLVDDYPVVDEAAIADAMRHTVERLHLVVEGGGAVGLAAVLSGAWLPPSDLGSGPIVIVLSGGNVATDTLLEILREGGRQDH